MLRTVVDIVKDSFNDFSEDKVPRWGAEGMPRRERSEEAVRQAS